MRLTAQADYAVVMMSAAARHGCGARLSATTLSGETGVPLATAQKLMQALARAGLLSSVRGAGGGFKLTRPAAAISVADIVEAIEGPIAMTTCVDHHRDHCALDHHCAVKPHWGPINAAVRAALSEVSLAYLSFGESRNSPDADAARASKAPAFAGAQA
jgi:FeS assembly SUF system regulator